MPCISFCNFITIERHFEKLFPQIQKKVLRTDQKYLLGINGRDINGIESILLLFEMYLRPKALLDTEGYLYVYVMEHEVEL